MTEYTKSTVRPVIRDMRTLLNRIEAELHNPNDKIEELAKELFDQSSILLTVLAE